MDTFLLILALLLGVAGALLLSEATLGVGVVALGCLAGILSRILQADRHKKESLQFMQQELEFLADKYIRSEGEPVEDKLRDL